MTPEEFGADMQAHGEAMTLKRAAVSDLPLYGKRVGEPVEHEGEGTTIETEYTVKVSRQEMAAASWPEPPRNTDQLVIGGRTYRVLSARQLDDAGDVFGYNLRVVGTP